jgi:hypothetical protein
MTKILKRADPYVLVIWTFGPLEFIWDLVIRIYIPSLFLIPYLVFHIP